MLIREKKLYDKELVDVKFINFFDNSAIVGKQKKTIFGRAPLFLMNRFLIFSKQISPPDLYENKAFGIFTLLNDECKQKCPITERFTENMNKYWKGHTTFKISLTPSSHKHEFSICHFAKQVCYSTVITNNKFMIVNSF